MDAYDSFRLHQARQALYRDMDSVQRRRIAAARRARGEKDAVAAEGDSSAAATGPHIHWQDHLHWHIPDTDPVLIARLQSEYLWRIVIWAVRNAHGLFTAYAQDSATAGDAEEYSKFAGNSVPAAYLWLRDRPLFRALVKEGISREITYPSDVYSFLVDFVLNQLDYPEKYMPWHDGEKSEQIEIMAPLRTMIVNIPPSYRNSRALDV